MTASRDPIQVLTDAIFREIKVFPSHERVDSLVREYRRTVLREAVAVIEMQIESAAGRYSEAFERSYDPSIRSAQVNQLDALREAKTAVEELSK